MTPAARTWIAMHDHRCVCPCAGEIHADQVYARQHKLEAGTPAYDAMRAAMQRSKDRGACCPDGLALLDAWGATLGGSR